MMRLLKGKTVVNHKIPELKAQVSRLRADDVEPTLAVIMAGKDPASELYLKAQKKMAVRIGIRQQNYFLPSNASQESFLSLIRELNQDSKIHAILVELPLPAHLDENLVTQTISADKDVDGMTDVNIGRLWRGTSVIAPATAAGIMTLLHAYRIQISGHFVVIVGRSQIVGRPLSALMLRENATVVIAHSHTHDLKDLTRQADILITDIGIPKLITSDMVKKESVIVDVGINRARGRLCGDVDFERVAPLVHAITPVPGGVGPVTVISLMQQVSDLARRQYGR